MISDDILRPASNENTAAGYYGDSDTPNKTGGDQ